MDRVVEPQFTGVRGAALIALRALGEFNTLEDTEPLVEISDTFDPNEDDAVLHRERYEQFVAFYKHTRKWYARVNHDLAS